MAFKQSPKNAWLQAVERWLVGTEVGGEQLAFPGMPVPPSQSLARALPFQLAFYGDKAGGHIRPTYTRLARLNNVSVDTVKRGLQLLEQSGLIRRCGPAFRGKAQEWQTVSPDWLQEKGGTGAPLSVGKGVQHAVGKGGTGAPPPLSPLKGTYQYASSDAPLGARVASAEDQSEPVMSGEDLTAFLNSSGLRHWGRVS